MKLKLAITSIITLISMGLFTAAGTAQFNPIGGVCQKAPNSPTCQQNNKQNGSNTNPAINTIRSATNIIAVVAGIGAVVMIVIGGFMFVTAGGATPGQRAGDPNRVKGARATITGAIIGLIIIALAWTIVTFVATRLVKT